MNFEINGTVIRQIVIDDRITTVFVTLPPEGYTKAELTEIFVREFSASLQRQLADQILGGTFRLNGRMLTEIALAAGAIAVRLGASAVELSTPDGEYNRIIGEGAPLSLPVPLLPGMIIEVIHGGGLLRCGARAVVLNVGRDSVNIAEQRSYRRRRDTSWTAIENVRPVGWEKTPRLE